MTKDNAGREVEVAETFVFLAEALVSGQDVVELLGGLIERCVELLDVAGGGIMLADKDGRLRVMAASSGHARLVEVLELQSNEGPCLDAFRDARPIHAPDLASQTTRWPQFVAAAQAAGYSGAYGLPLRLRDRAFGAMNLFRDEATPLDETDMKIAQAITDCATIALLSQREIERQEEFTAQLQSALDSRVAIEQAKGVLAERAGVSMDDAFAMLRRHARNTNSRLSAVAAEVANGTLDLSHEQLPSA